MPPASEWLPSMAGLIRSVGWAMGIAALATVLAWPVAWSLRGSGAAGAAWLLAPLLLPNYLAYSGWNLMRAPQTWLGDLSARIAQDGNPGFAVGLGHAVAVVGLVFWVWPLAAGVMTIFVSRLDAALLDAVELDERSAFGRLTGRVSLARGGLWATFGTVVLVMMGSPVPLHVAQIPTLAMQLWLQITEFGIGARVWFGAMPLVMLAIGGGYLLLRGLTAASEEVAGGGSNAAPKRLPWAAGIMLVLTAGVPLALNIGSVRHWSAAGPLWLVSRDAVGASVETAWFVGLAMALIAGLTAEAFAGFGRQGAAGDVVARDRRERLLLCGAMVFISAGIVPGVLVGAAVKASLALTPWTEMLLDSAAGVVLGHVARFGVVGVLIGLWIARSTPAAETDLRKIDGGGLWGWMIGALRSQSPALVAAGIAGFALSLHEVESTIILSPAGPGSLAQQMLNYLHQARQEELAIATVALGAAGLIGAIATAMLLRRFQAGGSRAGIGPATGTRGPRDR